MVIDLKITLVKDDLNPFFIHESHPVFVREGAFRKESRTIQTPYTAPIEVFPEKTTRCARSLLKYFKYFANDRTVV